MIINNENKNNKDNDKVNDNCNYLYKGDDKIYAIRYTESKK